MTSPPTVGLVCLHTCPFEQPGAGDAGGMNVYVRQLARALTGRGWAVRITTIGASGTRQVEPGIEVEHVDVGVPRTKAALAAALPAVTEALERRGPRGVDVLHAHYWLSGVAAVRMGGAWGVPVVQAMHTMALVKNAHLGPAQAPEPAQRVGAERELAARADRLIANGESEATDLVQLYGADRDRIDVVPPGVDLGIFRPASGADDADDPDNADDTDDINDAGGDEPGGIAAPSARHPDADPVARAAGGRRPPLRVVLAGRMQRHKGPQVLLDAAARLRRDRPDIALDVRVIGASSGGEDLDLPGMVTGLGLADVVRLEPPVAPAELAEAFRAADVVVMPSAHESFGLVALEAQACGTPVIATAVGGLSEVVQDGVTGLLVPGRDPGDWAAAIARLHDDPGTRASLAQKAAVHARTFTWDHTAALTDASYTRALGAVAGVSRG